MEKGLRAAKALGVPVDLEGPRPPASALAVTTTGFGPGSVPPKAPVPPSRPVPAVSPLGKAAAVTPMRFLRRIPADDAQMVLRDQLPALIQHHMQIIRNETVVWVAKAERRHGITLPDRPDPETIKRATAAQLAEIFSAARELR